MEFSAGESIGLPSKWKVELCSEEVDGKKWAGIYLALAKRPTFKSDFLFAHCTFIVKNRDGEVVISDDTGLEDMYKLGKNCGWGVPEFIERDGNPESLMEEADALIIYATFKIYFPSMSVIIPSLEATLTNFLTESRRKAMVDLAELQKFETLTDIKIMSREKKSSTAKREIISARSPVFDATLKSNMTEGKEGIIRIPDMRSKSLRVLLNYISDGGLAKDWRKSEVLVELTNAAAKYQLPELLNFLDQVAGKICDADNAGALMILANRLPLKQAEKDILSFVRINGAGSSDSFIKIMKCISSTSETEKSSPDVVGANMTEGENGRDDSPVTSGSPNPTGKRVAAAAEEVNGNGDIDKECPLGKRSKHAEA